MVLFQSKSRAASYSDEALKISLSKACVLIHWFPFSSCRYKALVNLFASSNICRRTETRSCAFASLSKISDLEWKTGIGETSPKIIGTCMISVGTNVPNHNPAINNVNCKALGGREHLLGYVLASNHGRFGDEQHRERVDSGRGRAPRHREAACEWC